MDIIAGSSFFESTNKALTSLPRPLPSSYYVQKSDLVMGETTNKTPWYGFSLRKDTGSTWCTSLDNGLIRALKGGIRN